ncbi:hypothetical protein [Leptospira ilyithenensis]|uniref:Uncharacterized protein n=1 Tax=Leptospira ilyithenensis TaxID=2484901 RepID=A0A4R9LJ68_9LEPT|nr:hypothetical protein [Leptospira ilyithenensis]TGN06917.1 hypothetical protein EHS11_17420 [Leptospira ilyithenensis]
MKRPMIYFVTFLGFAFFGNCGNVKSRSSCLNQCASEQLICGLVSHQQNVSSGSSFVTCLAVYNLCESKCGGTTTGTTRTTRTSSSSGRGSSSGGGSGGGSSSGGGGHGGSGH